MTLGEDIERRGWRCGSVVAGEMLPTVAPYLVRPGGGSPVAVSADDWLIISSQTCDVVARQLDAEPYVEVLHCTNLKGKPRKGFRNLESTRHLDFRPNRGTHSDVVLTAHAVKDRYIIPRQILATSDPDTTRSLDNIASSRVLAWYALRAGRPSWPNKFCDRISSATKALKDALEPLADEVAQVRVSIAEKDCELRDDEPYHITVFFIVDEEIWNADVDGRQMIYKAFSAFTTELDGCDGIELNQDISSVVSGSEFTWQEVQQTDLWNFANLSQHDT